MFLMKELIISEHPQEMWDLSHSHHPQRSFQSLNPIPDMRKEIYTKS